MGRLVFEESVCLKKQHLPAVGLRGANLSATVSRSASKVCQRCQIFCAHLTSRNNTCLLGVENVRRSSNDSSAFKQQFKPALWANELLERVRLRSFQPVQSPFQSLRSAKYFKQFAFLALGVTMQSTVASASWSKSLSSKTSPNFSN